MPNVIGRIRRVREKLEGTYRSRHADANSTVSALERGDRALGRGEYKTALHEYEEAKDPERLKGLGYTILGQEKIPASAGRVAVEAMEQARKLKPKGETTHGKIVRGSFYSQSLGKEMRYNAYIPPGYSNSTERYPAIYFFNSAFGNQNEWLVAGKLHEAVDELGSKGLMGKTIMVMPDMGNGTVLEESELTKNMKIVQRWIGKGKYDEYVVKDLIPHIDSKFRTIADRRGRATDGACQGGTNAVAIALKHPDKFSSAAGHTMSYYNSKLGGRAKDVKVYMDVSYLEPMYMEGRGFSRRLEKAGVEHVFAGYADAPNLVKKDFWRDLKTLGKNYTRIPVAERVGILALAALTPHSWPTFRKRVKNSLMFHSANFENAASQKAG